METARKWREKGRIVTKWKLYDRKIKLPMNLTREQVKHIADLCRLYLSEEEISHFVHDLISIFRYIEKLNELDTSQIDPTFQTVPLRNVLRDDEVKESLPRDLWLKGTPEHDTSSIKVPKIIDEVF